MAIKEVFLNQVVPKAIELLKAPSTNKEMIWLVTPLIIAALFMTFYFSRYKKELSSKYTYGNFIVLIFISLDLARYIFHLTNPASFSNYLIHKPEAIITLVVFIESIFLLYASYLNFLSKKLFFFISSPLPVNLTAYVVMAIIYTGVKPDLMTLYAALLLFIALFIVLHVLQWLQRAIGGRTEEVKQEEESQLDKVTKTVKEEKVKKAKSVMKK